MENKTDIPIYQIVEKKFKCEHEMVRLRLRGKNQYVYQCDTCGRATTTAIAHAHITPEQRATVTPFDSSIIEQWQKGKKDYSDSLHEMRKSEMSVRYAAWRRSPEWQEQRGRVLRRDGYMCQACNSNQAIQVHHLTYAYHPHTPDFYLQSVCKRCHERIHGKG